MKHFILVGIEAIESFRFEDWKGLEENLKENVSGDLISFDYSEKNAVSELLQQLNGWSEYIELSLKDIQRIEKNSKIEIIKK